MVSGRGMDILQGVAVVSSFVTNLLPFRPRRGLGSWWFLVNNFEEIGLVGNRFMRGSNPPDCGSMSLVHLALPPFIGPRDAPAAERRIGHQGAGRDVYSAGQVPFDSNGGQVPLHQPPEWHVSDERRPLDAGILGLVSRWLDIPLPPVQVHSGAFTNRLLNSYHADAMTVGREIYIKTDKSDPRSASGLALLTHELTHVGQQLLGSGDAVHAPPGRQEQIALENERLVLLHAHAHLGPQNAPLVPSPGSTSVRPPLGLRGSATLPRGLGVPSAGPRLGVQGPHAILPGPAFAPGVPHHTEARAVTPMFADASRSTAAPEPVPSAPPTPTPVGLSNHDMERIKAEVYHDLLWRIKTEFERGS